ncbi:permease [Porticoccus sp. W117]|uniref:permease n=1 Tax=Porticoccus sp. W117 TaxID=3054777 RepID=UPI00259A50CC|nr:permease [Porticoccus sp. W117]MDM3870361.1 permease [Porticoccus sp. W117]
MQLISIFSLSLNNKRLWLTSILVLAIAVVFWAGSRYPNLSEKATMGGYAQVESPLSFDSVLDIQAGDPAYKEVLFTLVNWAVENRKGMVFGLCLGAALLSLINLLRRRGSNNGWLNALIGMGSGSALGVCVNCAAPVAKGMHSAGARLETTLAAMFSSPTLNVIVLTMVFSIFPLYLALIKVGLTLLFILVVIPLLSRTLFSQVRAGTYLDMACTVEGTARIPSESWGRALLGVIAEFGKSLWYLIKTTVPLMILAGLLGAALVTFLPLDSLLLLEIGLLGALIVTLVGLFLPLPIALDVVIAASLLSAGLPVFYVSILLLVLGTFSIYPFMIVWQSMSRTVAVALSLALVVLAIAGGYLADYQYEQQLKALYEFTVE